MKAKDIRDLSQAEVAERLRDEEHELAQLRFQHAIAELQNPMILRNKRREIARLKTILKQKEA